MRPNIAYIHTNLTCLTNICLHRLSVTDSTLISWVGLCAVWGGALLLHAAKHWTITVNIYIYRWYLSEHLSFTLWKLAVWHFYMPHNFLLIIYITLQDITLFCHRGKKDNRDFPPHNGRWLPRTFHWLWFMEHIEHHLDKNAQNGWLMKQHCPPLDKSGQSTET